jgi:hypothetical protein
MKPTVMVVTLALLMLGTTAAANPPAVTGGPNWAAPDGQIRAIDAGELMTTIGMAGLCVEQAPTVRTPPIRHAHRRDTPGADGSTLGARRLRSDGFHVTLGLHP